MLSPALLVLAALASADAPVAPTTATTATTATTPTATAAPTAPAGPVDVVTNRARVLVLDLQGVGADPKLVRLTTGVVAGIVAESPAIDVATSADVRAMMDLEAEKQTAGCDAAGCFADLAGALGARYVVHGDVGQLGTSLIVNLAIFDSQKGESVTRQTIEVPSTDLLRRRLRPALVELLRPIGALPEEAKPVNPLVIVGGVSAGVGGVAVLGGGVVALIGELAAGTGELPLAEKTGAITAGQGGAIVGGVGLLVGAVGAGLLTYALLQDEP
jgi:TolB-like protein